MTVTTSAILGLPNALLLNVLSYFEINELCTIARVCNRIKKITEDDSLWAPKCQFFFKTKMYPKKSWKENCIAWIKNWNSYPVVREEMYCSSRVFDDEVCVTLKDQEVFVSPTHTEPFLPGEEGKFKSLLSLDSDRLAVAYTSGEIGIWDIKKKTKITEVNYQDNFRKIRLKGKCISAIGQDNHLKIWDSSTGQLRLESIMDPKMDPKAPSPTYIDIVHLKSTANHVVAAISEVALVWSIHQQTSYTIKKEAGINAIALENEWLALGTGKSIEIYDLFKQTLFRCIPNVPAPWCFAMHRGTVAFMNQSDTKIKIINFLKESEEPSLKELDNPRMGQTFEPLSRIKFAPASLILFNFNNSKMQIVNFFTNKKIWGIESANSIVSVKHNKVICTSRFSTCQYDFSVHGPLMSFVLRIAAKVRYVVWSILREIERITYGIRHQPILFRIVQTIQMVSLRIFTLYVSCIKNIASNLRYLYSIL